MTMKNGFSTINRLLGKHKESNSNLSKSSTNLSVTKSTVNINDSSQVHQNRITPLPIATSNAPFEQTFRITVLLPKDQLYVARLGARVLLHKLLDLVCENKQLDPDKYEFQHPADPSQIFSCDLTIGAVGLSEIRLCNKSEYSNAIRTDDVTYRRNSFSSSKFSRNSKNISISNTPSLYSSRNSLNSMSSSGIDSNFRNITPDVVVPKHLAPVIPVRKKRPAPRPPSQNVSLENDVVLQTKTSEFPSNTVTSNYQHPVLTQPNLGNTLEKNDLNKSNLSIDCNGNTKGSLQNNGRCIAQCVETSREAVKTSDKVVLNETHNSVENISTFKQPEPSPRRKVQTLPKKSYPVAPPRSTKSPTEKVNETQPEEEVHEGFTTLQVTPVALPRSASTGGLISQPIEQITDIPKNVSEIFINQSPTVVPSLLLQTTDVKSTHVQNINLTSKDDGEEQIDLSWNSSCTQSSAETKHKSFIIESSSEDDEMIKVYDLKLGKTIVKTLSNHKTSSEVLDGVLPINEPQQIDQQISPPGEEFVSTPNIAVDSSEKYGFHNISGATEEGKDDLPGINSSILDHHTVVSPVVSPESFVPSCKEKKDNSLIEDHFSQQKITEEINIKCENLPQEPEIKQTVTEKTITEESKEVKDIDIISAESLSQEPLLRQSHEFTTFTDTKQSIENSNDKLQSKVSKETISNCNQTHSKQEPLISTLERLIGDEELLHEQQLNESITQTNPSIQTKSALSTRSSSFQLESNNQRNYTTEEYFSRRRRSSSELSIGESPSLQSLGVIKSILNSRKNSINSTEESKRQTPPIECDIQSMEEPSPKINNILKTSKLKTAEKEKVYRYSGPPNIHFSTWSERPKVQVLIKNEQDCIFDRSKSGGQNITKTVVNRGDLALQRNNLNDGIEKRAITGTSSNYSNDKEVGKPYNSSSTSTMPKFMFGGRTSNPWPIAPATSNTLTHNNNNRPLSQPILRSTSMTGIISKPVIKQAQPAFGQGTLRKTGFKEKIVPLQDTGDVVDVAKPIPFALKNQTNPQTTPKITKISIRTDVPVSTVPEAPPPPIIRAVVTKQKTNNNRTQLSLTVDPRDQLLSAIRNFKRDELKNSNIY